MPVTTSLIEMCQAVWTLLRTERQKKDMTKAIGPTYFGQRSFERSPERGHVIYKGIFLMCNHDAK